MEGKLCTYEKKGAGKTFPSVGVELKLFLCIGDDLI